MEIMQAYAIAMYLVVSISMTIWVARVLSESGQVFLVKCFGHDKELAQSTNRLLVIGFYLINIGLICTRMGDWGSGRDVMIQVFPKIGISVLMLGAMHFFNMFMVAKFGRLIKGWAWVEHEAEGLPTNPVNPSNSTAD